MKNYYQPEAVLLPEKERTPDYRPQLKIANKAASDKFDNIKIIAYNILANDGSELRDWAKRVAGLIREERPDIVALQNPRTLPEAGFAKHLKHLTRATELNYCRSRMLSLKSGRAVRLAILSRRPSVNPRERSSKPTAGRRRPMVRADLKLNSAERIHLFNLKLSNPEVPGKLVGRGILNRLIYLDRSLPDPIVVVTGATKIPRREYLAGFLRHFRPVGAFNGGRTHRSRLPNQLYINTRLSVIDSYVADNWPVVNLPEERPLVAILAARERQLQQLN